MKKFKKFVLFVLAFCFVLNTIGFGTYASSNSAILEVVKDETSSLPNTGKRIKFVLKGTNLDTANIKAKVVSKESKVREKSIENTLVYENNDNRNSSNVRIVSINFPENNDTKSKTYIVTFNSSGKIGDDDFNEEYKTEIKVRKALGGTTSEDSNPIPSPDESEPDKPKPSEPTDAKILGTEITEKTLESNGGDFEFAVFTTKNVSSENVKVKVICDDKLTDIGNNATISGEGARKLIRVNFPENNSSKEKVYKLTFNAKNSMSDFQQDPIVLVKISAMKSKEMKVSEVKVNKPNLTKDGGITKLNIRGENLDKSKILVKIFKDDILQSDLTKDLEFNGTNEILSCFINLPKANKNTEVYKIKVFEIGSENEKGECEVVVGENSSSDLTVLNPTSVFVDKTGKVITLKFDEKIFPVVNILNVKKSILLDVDGDGHFDNLSVGDDVSIDNDRVIIKLENNISVKLNSKIIVKERVLKDSKNREGSELIFFITKAKPMIQKVEFLEGELLENTGGNVKIKFTGENLDNTLTKVIKIKKHSDIMVDIPVNLEKISDKEQIISFKVPENKGTNPESYMVKASLDNGETYTSYLGVNIYDRTKRLIVTVLPKGVDKTKPVLSFMTIQSYGTSGGGTDVPDNTHTNSPIGQESKKTFVYVYGANLEKNLTKVKIVDKNGIEWTPVNDPSSDSMDQFIMVGFDGTGIDGWGNNQMLEIICPRNIVGDNTYKYLVAVDGENFNEEIFVTATVLDDGDRPKHEATLENIKSVKVKYQDKDANELSESKTIKGYVWTKAVSFGIEYKEIDNYELVGYKTNTNSEVKDISILNEKLADADEIILIYEKKSTDNLSNKIFKSSDDKVYVETKALDKNSKLIYEKLISNDKNVEVLDINFVGKDGSNIVCPDGDYLVRIRKINNNKVLRVYHIDDDNKTHDLNFKDTDKYVEFKTNHFSKYAIEYKENVDKVNIIENIIGIEGINNFGKTDISKNKNIENKDIENKVEIGNKEKLEVIELSKDNNADFNNKAVEIKSEKICRVNKKTLPKTSVATISLIPMLLSGAGLIILRKRK